MMPPRAWKALADCPRYHLVRAAIASAARFHRGDADGLAWAVVPALYWAAIDCHSGQWSDTYALACALGSHYRPGACENGVDPDDPLAGEVYSACMRAWGGA